MAVGVRIPLPAFFYTQQLLEADGPHAHYASEEFVFGPAALALLPLEVESDGADLAPRCPVGSEHVFAFCKVASLRELWYRLCTL